jgi:5-methylcytosine-specific restriction endonuclease McrA
MWGSVPGNSQVRYYFHMVNSRKHLTDRIKREINEEYGHRCAYCSLKLGSVVSKKGRHTLLEPNYDHFVPFAYARGNQRMNWVLSCIVCNMLKHDDLYDSPAHVINGIAEKRLKYVLIWEPSVAMTEDVNVWGVKYAKWLATPDDDDDDY